MHWRAARSKRADHLRVADWTCEADEPEIDGQRLVAVNGGRLCYLTEAVFLLAHCETQANVDYFCQKLASDGGAESG